MGNASNADRLVFSVDDRDYTIHIGRFNAIDAKDFRHNVGVSLAQVFGQESVDLDVIAGLVWLSERKTNPALTYAAVAKRFTYDANIDMHDPEDDTSTEDINDPET